MSTERKSDDSIEENCEDAEILDDEPRNILSGLISQLRKGMDLHRVTLPTFVLEPRSMCERITDFMSHPDLVLRTAKKEDPVERFVDVVRYYLSGWHIKPKGVKKPYNPILGEHFRCRWTFPDSTEALFVSEQVSHHPPVSAYYYASPENNIVIVGDMRPKSKFLGNSAATVMEGFSRVEFTNRPGEEYVINLPTVYARGILFGTMMLEMGDQVTVKCEKTDLICEIDFKTKGFFSGTYNTIGGKIKCISTGECLYDISGKWTDVMYLKKKNGEREVFFDARTAAITRKIVAPEAQQNENESRRLWSKVTAAILSRNLDQATIEKSVIEDGQRQAAKERESEGIDWTPKYFVASGNDWKFRLHHLHGKLSSDPVAAKKEIESVIWPQEETFPPYHA